MKALHTLPFAKRDRALSIAAEGSDPEKFEFSNSMMKDIRREKKMSHRQIRRQANTVIEEQLEEMFCDLEEGIRVI